MAKQNYEEYWKLTVEYTDINSDNFIGTLKIIVDFIDTNFDALYTKELYKEVQELVYDSYPKTDMGSVRKSINQFVKLGFINSKLESYNPGTKDFLNAITNRKRKSLFSKIFYSYSSFNSSITNNFVRHEINFIIKTLEEVGKLSKDDITALMLVDIVEIKKGYLTKDELFKAVTYANEIDFKIRKYNQVGYLFNFLGKLEDVLFVKDILYFEEDAKNILGNDIDNSSKKRDMYLHRLYKNELKEESVELFGNVKCMLEQLAYPVLIASHIKPFVVSDSHEAYDPNNGLLLSRTIDSLFDLNYITFNSNGEIVFSNHVSEDVISFWKDYKLNIDILNKERLKYLEYHNSLLRGEAIVS